jgi:hypothetical protein
MVVVENLAKAWMAPIEEVRRASEFSVKNRFAILQDKGDKGSSMFGVHVEIIRKPAS